MCADEPLPGIEWVTKTNVTDFYRCPRTYWLIAHGRITHEASISPPDLARAEAGVTFEQDVVDDALTVDAGTVASARDLVAADGQLLVLRTGLWVNKDLGLRGEPDGIGADSRAWAPVEVKHHAGPTPMDRLELAFYWLLLAPQRTDQAARPHGYLVLSGTGGSVELVRVDLRPHHLSEAHRYIEAVRSARVGPEPHGCGSCYVCRTQPPHPAVAASHHDDLDNLFSLGEARTRQLALIGIHGCDDLLTLGIDEILNRLRGQRWGIGLYQVEGWIAHAQAWASDAPVIYGEPPPMPADYISFDLEYLRQGHTWLAGMRPVGGELTQLWTWDAAGERGLMRDLADYWAAHPETTMATWWGTGADLPALARASRRTGIAFNFDKGRHFDLCLWAMGHLRLPIRSLSLKDVAAYFGVLDPDHDIDSGDDAAWIYLQAGNSRGRKARKEARTRLQAYNAADVECVIRLIELLRTGCAQAVDAAVGPAAG